MRRFDPISGYPNPEPDYYRYPRALLAERRDGVLCACCLRCFAETLPRREVSRFGIEPLKSVFRFSWSIPLAFHFSAQSKAETRQRP
jgi:hypothetical protein